MSIKFYTDTHIAKQVAVQLIKNGIDIVRCQDVGLEDADDDIHLEYAAANERALITKDDDFITMHYDWQTIGKEHSGIFYCPYRDKAMIGLIVEACKEYYEMVASGVGTIDDIKNQVFYIK